MSARSSGTAQLLERDTEIDVIERALERSWGGSGGVVLVQAPAGVGKTEVLRMAGAGGGGAAGGGGRAARGRGAAAGGRPARSRVGAGPVVRVRPGAPAAGTLRP